MTVTEADGEVVVPSCCTVHDVVVCPPSAIVPRLTGDAPDVNVRPVRLNDAVVAADCPVFCTVRLNVTLWLAVRLLPDAGLLVNAKV